MNCGMARGGVVRVVVATLVVGTLATSGWAQPRSRTRQPGTQAHANKSYGASRAVPVTSPRPTAPSYELSVESVPDWALDDEQPAAAVFTAPRMGTPPGRAPRSTNGGGQHEAGYRGRHAPAATAGVEPGTVPVPLEAMADVGPSESVPAEGIGSDPADPIYSAGAMVPVDEGVERQVLHPVEVIDGSATCSAQGSACQFEHDGGICDVVYRSYGCNREPCPCPTDEVLSYYRCENYGYFPTFWRPWPCGWLKYRPDVSDTAYDRFRKTAPAEGNGGGIDPGLGPEPRSSSDEDLDRELQEMLRTAPTPGRAPTPPGRQRRPPELLPEESMPEPPRRPDAPSAPPPKVDGQSGLPPRSAARFAASSRRVPDTNVEAAAYRPYPTAIPRAGAPNSRFRTDRPEEAVPARSGGIKISRRRTARNDL